MAEGKKPKYIFVVGGVMSGVGKGVTTSSVGAVLQAKGFNVTLMKADPYLNVDAGTMNPTEHGEVFVLDSGLETDQDMGNYERFLNKSLPDTNYMTNGMVFKHIIDKERSLGFEGKCVEYFYHVPQEIKRRIEACRDASGADIIILEIGGTIGEYHNALFIEAARTIALENPGDAMFIMVSFLPVPSTLGEMKTKPTQNAVQQLRSFGVSPDIVIARAETSLDAPRKQKIANFVGGIAPEDVISAPDVQSIYDIPLNFEADGLGSRIVKRLGLDDKPSDMKPWEKLVDQIANPEQEVKIAIIGKYFDTGEFVLSDAYISVIEALKISGFTQGVKPVIDYIDSTRFEDNPEQLERLKQYDGVLIPGGFGSRGIEGKIAVVRYARENKIPYFGLCYGMQVMVIEYARNVVGLTSAHTREIDPTSPHLVINVMEDQKDKLAEENYGGTMRLGAYPAVLKDDTIACEAYGAKEISERHRHRYEVNPEFISTLQDKGFVFSGTSPDGLLMEIAELPREVHPFFLGTQFHPEFLSRPLSPHPLFSEFIKAAINQNK
jgi:CTP synthase